MRFAANIPTAAGASEYSTLAFCDSISWEKQRSFALAAEAGTVRAANIVLLWALSATPKSPFSLEVLQNSIRRYLPEKIVALNLKALEMGFQHRTSSQPG